MAKLFYTIDEAADKLGKPKSELEQMVREQKLEEFKMHDVVHFKRAAIDQLVVDDLGELDLGLADSSQAGTPGSDDELSFSSGDNLSFGSGSEFDLGLDAPLSLADSDAGIAVPKAPTPSHSEGSSIAGIGGSGASDPLASGASDPLGLADSAAKSSMNSPASGSNKGSGMDLDLGLDLGLDGPGAMGSGLGGSGLGLADSNTSSRHSPAPDASGSMAAKSGAASRDDSAEFRPAQPSGHDSGGLNLETVGSGSGMLDLTGDSDQSTMGAALLEDPGDDGAGVAELGGASGIFADPNAQAEELEAAPVAAAARQGSAAAFPTSVAVVVDTAGSGLGVGLLTGALAAIAIAGIIVMGTRLGGGSAVASMVTGDLYLWLGALAGGTIVAGGIGFFVGRAIE